MYIYTGYIYTYVYIYVTYRYIMIQCRYGDVDMTPILFRSRYKYIYAVGTHKT